MYSSVCCYSLSSLLHARHCPRCCIQQRDIQISDLPDIIFEWKRKFINRDQYIGKGRDVAFLFAFFVAWARGVHFIYHAQGRTCWKGDICSKACCRQAKELCTWLGEELSKKEETPGKYRVLRREHVWPAREVVQFSMAGAENEGCTVGIMS